MTTNAEEPARPRRGRPPVKPSVHDDKAIDTLCDYLVTGMGMRQACAQPDAPNECDVYRRMAKDAALLGRIARARETQQHALIDEIIPLADSATEDNWQVIRLRIWARQWQAGKLAPRIYSDKLDLHHTGTVAAAPIPIDLATLTPTQLRALDDVLLLVRSAPVARGEE
jgi:transposase